jgi:hypothetical protein
MYKIFGSNKDIHDNLLPWKALSGDLTEFSEVRNKWIYA